MNIMRWFQGVFGGQKTKCWAKQKVSYETCPCFCLHSSSAPLHCGRGEVVEGEASL